jgi:hypothetical protein
VQIADEQEASRRRSGEVGHQTSKRRAGRLYGSSSRASLCRCEEATNFFQHRLRDRRVVRSRRGRSGRSPPVPGLGPRDRAGRARDKGRRGKACRLSPPRRPEIALRVCEKAQFALGKWNGIRMLARGVTVRWKWRRKALKRLDSAMETAWPPRREPYKILGPAIAGSGETPLARRHRLGRCAGTDSGAQAIEKLESPPELPMETRCPMKRHSPLET